MFKDFKFQEKHFGHLDYFIKEIAKNAAAFDLILKSDRYLGRRDNQGVLGNYLFANNKLWPIDHEMVLLKAGPNKPFDFWMKLLLNQMNL